MATKDSDRRFFWRWTVTALVLLALPYVALAVLTPGGGVYTWTLFSPNDAFLYLSQMFHSHQGDWEFTNAFSYVRTPSVPIFPLYTLLGKLIPGPDTPLSAGAVFHLARLALGLLFMQQVWRLYGEILPGRAARRVAFLFVAFTAGLAFYQILLDQRAGPPFDLAEIESHSFFGLLHAPHFAATLLLMVVYLRSLWALTRAEGSVARPAVVGSMAIAALSTIHPEKVVALILAGGLFLAWKSIVQRPRRAQWLAWGVTAAAGGPYLALLYTLTQGPLGETIRQGRQPTRWDAGYYLLGFGIPALCAVARVPALLRRRARASDGEALLWALLLSSLALLVLPGDLVAHRAEGMQIAIAGLAGRNLVHDILPRFWRSAVFAWLARQWAGGHRRRRLRFLSLNLVIIASAPTVLALTFASPRAGLADADELYLSSDDVAAVTWMAGHAGRDEVVAGTPQSNQFVAAYAGMRIVLAGHWSYVRDLQGEARALERLFREPEEIRPYLVERDVRWVYFGPRERRQAAWDPAKMPYLNPAYRHGTTTVYRVVPDSGT